MPRPERVEAFRLGLSAESRAALLLTAKAYRILARRWTTPFGEIEIVARRRGVLVFVEEEAVTERSKRRIVGAAERRHPDHANCEIRFNVIVVTPGKMPRHIANAFDARALNGSHYISIAQFDGKMSMRNVTSPTLTLPNAASPV